MARISTDALRDAVQDWADEHSYIKVREEIPEWDREQLQAAWDAFGQWTDADGNYLDARDVLNHPDEYDPEVWNDVYDAVYFYVVEVMEYMTPEEFQARYGAKE